jgi:tRNA (cytidine/uridine-2'-O-)-methyltransferase
MLEIALYQPDIAANAGTIARLCACFGMPLTIIEPAGFIWTDSAFRRSAMDYFGHVDVRRANSWTDFKTANIGRRLVLSTTKSNAAHHQFAFRRDDILLFGRESSGVPEEVRAVCEGVTIPMRAGMRSLNVAVAAGIVAAEAMRQIGDFDAGALS